MNPNHNPKHQLSAYLILHWTVTGCEMHDVEYYSAHA